MFGQNPKRSYLKNDGSILEVQEIFSTLQGEGLYVGWPAVFIRLGGCNLACSFCDTEFETFSQLSLDDVLKQTIQLANAGNIKLVVLTGGEPFRQPISRLCTMLLEQELLVQIETNGTLYQEIDPRVDVVCSPKNNKGIYANIRPDLLERVSAFKFIVSAHNKQYSEVTEIGQSKYNVPVYVQPMDEQDSKINKDNLDFAVDLALRYGYRLSIQLHKLIGVK